MPIVFSERKKRIIRQSLLGIACVSIIAAVASFQVPQEQVKGEVIRQPLVVSNWPDEVLPLPSEEPYIEPEVITPSRVITQPSPSPTPLVVSCGLNNNTVYITMPKSECDAKQAEENERIRSSRREVTPFVLPSLAPFPSFAPFPSVEPYKPSQEYLDAQAKLMESMAKEWKPTQFEPKPTCTPVGDGFNCF